MKLGGFYAIYFLYHHGDRCRQRPCVHVAYVVWYSENTPLSPDSSVHEQGQSASSSPASSGNANEAANRQRASPVASVAVQTSLQLPHASVRLGAQLSKVRADRSIQHNVTPLPSNNYFSLASDRIQLDMTVYSCVILVRFTFANTFGRVHLLLRVRTVT